ncbi:5427_t:CDS:1, partial [Diversispora eburnea]
EITQESTTNVTKKTSRSSSSDTVSQHSMSHGEYVPNSKKSNRENTDDSQGPIFPTKFCKICQEPELIEEQEDGTIIYEKGKLISPCKCKGSLQYVHLDCLNKWRTTNLRPDASYQCEVCKYNYKFYRPKLARFIGSKIFLHILSITSFLAIIYGVSWIVKVIDINVINKDRAPNPPGWKHIEIIGVEVIHLIIGLSLVSFLGLIFLIITSCFEGARTTRETYCYCGGCECISCYGCLWFGDCSGGGDLGGFVLLLAVIIGILMFIVGMFVALCTGYLLTQKVSNIYLDRIQEKILEVEKD